MGKRNPYQRQINAADFITRLKQSDPETWDILLEYVRRRVRAIARRRPLPRGLDLEEVVEDYVGEASLLIVEKLGEFQEKGRLSAFIDKLIRTAISDRSLKNLLGAVTRFLEAANKLSPAGQHELRTIIHDCPVGKDILLACMDAVKLESQSNRQYQHLWYAARQELLHDPDFVRLLCDLSKEGFHQAKTILVWQNALEGPGPPPTPAPYSEQERDPDMDALASSEPTPLDELLEREDKQVLLECLAELRQKSAKLYQAIERKFYHDESYKQISEALGIKMATARKRIERGLGNLHDCMARKYLTQDVQR